MERQGIVALMLAVRRPELVRRLVVSGASAVPDTRAMLQRYRVRLSGDSAGGWAMAIEKPKTRAPLAWIKPAVREFLDAPAAP